MIALRSHCRPKISSSVPTTRRSPSIGMRVSAGPSTATTTASATVAATTPISVERQPRVTPTARTIVNASTISTAEARKAARTRIDRTRTHAPISFSFSLSCRSLRLQPRSTGPIDGQARDLGRSRWAVVRPVVAAPPIDLVLEGVEQFLAPLDPDLDLVSATSPPNQSRSTMRANQRRIFSRSWPISSASSKV